MIQPLPAARCPLPAARCPLPAARQPGSPAVRQPGCAAARLCGSPAVRCLAAAPRLLAGQPFRGWPLPLTRRLRGPGQAGRTRRDRNGHLAERQWGHRDYVLREIHPSAGQSTGWHTHDGNLYATAKAGALSHFDSSCESDGIARSVGQAAAGSSSIADNITGVVQAAHQVTSGATETQQTASQLARTAADLQSTISTYRL